MSQEQGPKNLQQYVARAAALAVRHFVTQELLELRAFKDRVTRVGFYCAANPNPATNPDPYQGLYWCDGCGEPGLYKYDVPFRCKYCSVIQCSRCVKKKPSELHCCLDCSSTWCTVCAHFLKKFEVPCHFSGCKRKICCAGSCERCGVRYCKEHSIIHEDCDDE
jgi:hypothetical protein